jgi:hypothetical protein
MRWWIGLCLGLVLCTASLSYPDDRRGSPFPEDEHWEGSRTWTPDRYSRRRGLVVPDQFTIDGVNRTKVRKVSQLFKCHI